MAISRPRETRVSKDDESVVSAIVTDEKYRLLYTGGLPLLVFNTDDDSTVEKFSLNGTIKYAAVGMG